MVTKVITPKQQLRSAQMFTFFSIIAVLLLPAIFPMFLWIAASIFVYAAAAHHPNKRVCDYVRYSGYRFYGVVGALVAILNFSPQLAKWAGGWLQLIGIIWLVAILVIVPLGIRDLRRCQRENWQEMKVEVE